MANDRYFTMGNYTTKRETTLAFDQMPPQRDRLDVESTATTIAQMILNQYPLTEGSIELEGSAKILRDEDHRGSLRIEIPFKNACFKAHTNHASTGLAIILSSMKVSATESITNSWELVKEIKSE
jgi:hypothetical protein